MTPSLLFLPGARMRALCISAAFGLTLALAGCQSPSSGPALRGPTLAGLPPPPLAPVAMNLSRKSPNLRVDHNLLDLDGFFPPGARRVGPNQRGNFTLLADQRTRYPSTDVCASPDKHFVLFHDGMKRRSNDIYHWLMLLKHDAPFPNAIFLTKLAFDVSWSQDSRHFAVTHFVGDNSSEVFVVGVDDLERKPIDLRPFLEEHFPPHVVSMPMFVRMYRWTADGQLVVRAIGRAREEPFDLFGCEVAVSFASVTGEPQVRFLRGYVKPQEEEP